MAHSKVFRRSNISQDLVKIILLQTPLFPILTAFENVLSLNLLTNKKKFLILISYIFEFTLKNYR